MNHTKGIFISILAASVLTACGGGGGGGGGGSLPASIDNEVGVAAASLYPGRGTTAIASAEARRERITEMTWRAERIQGVGGADIVLSNADCSQATLSYDDNLGEGECLTTIIVPDDATPGRWRISNTAINANGERASASAEIVVTDPPYTGFRLYVPSVPTVASVGDMVSVSSYVTTPTQLGPAPYVQFEWEQTSGPTATLTGQRTPSITFAAREPGEYGFLVTAKVTIDGIQRTATASTSVVVQDPAADRLILSAGAPQIASVGEVVELAGSVTASDSLDVSKLAFQWEQIGGPSVMLANANSLTAGFVPSQTGTYVFELRATGGNLGLAFTEVAQTIVNVVSGVNVAGDVQVSAGNAQAIDYSPGTAVTLTGQVKLPSNMSSATLDYQWTQVSGPTAGLFNQNASTASAILSAAGTYVFQLTVTGTGNGQSFTKSATTAVLMRNP